MSNLRKLVTAALVPGAVALGVMGPGATGADAGGPVRCDIQVSGRGGGVTLEGVVYAKTAVEGSYRLRVTQSGGSGSSNINQGGDFNAGPGGAVSLGTVTLGGSGAYVARLEVSWGGGHTVCSERVGGSL